MLTAAVRSRFFIALLPSQEIQDYANTVIRELGDRYRMGTAKAPPHITLQPPFEWLMQDLSSLEECLQSFGQQSRAVPVTLSGFGAFAPRVLYLNVLKTPDLLHLQATLIAHLEQTLGIVDPKSSRPFAPHLTVASRNVTRQTFRQAWAELQLRQAEFHFVSDRLTLLIHDGQQWQVQTEFVMAL